MSALISKLPWKFHANDRTGERSGRSLLVVDATGRDLLQVNDYSDRDEHVAIANAAFIVRACNSHDALIEIARSARLQLKLWMRDHGQDIDSNNVIVAIDAALSRATSN